MKKGRFSDAQIMGILRETESGVPVLELCREHGMSSASFYKSRTKFGGTDASHDVADEDDGGQEKTAEASAC